MSNFRASARWSGISCKEVVDASPSPGLASSLSVSTLPFIFFSLHANWLAHFYRKPEESNATDTFVTHPLVRLRSRTFFLLFPSCDQSARSPNHVTCEM